MGKRIVIKRSLPIVGIIWVIFTVSCLTDNQNMVLQDIFDEAWSFRLNENPLFATGVGIYDTNDRLPLVTEKDIQRRGEYWQDVLKQLDSIDLDRLNEKNRINYKIFYRIVQGRLSDIKFKAYLIPLNADSGFHIALARLPNNVPLKSVTDYENYISRLNAIPDYIAQHIELMREGIRIGMTIPKIVLNGYDITISTHVVNSPEESVFYEPFISFPTSVSAHEHNRLRQMGRKAIMTGAIEGYSKFLTFFNDEYYPNARETIGASDLPDGQAYYEQRTRHFTTLDLSPEEIHNIGLQEVKRIKGEMTEIITEVEFDGSFQDFLNFLRTDRQFYAKTPEDLLKEASFIAKKMDAKLPSLFNNLPRLPYGVQAVPDHIAPKYTGGRYVGPAEGSTEPGYYWVNTYALGIRPLYNLEALTLHEAVPGHHLQNAIARELDDVPMFRKHLYLSAFGEGWGLYSEWLGLEAGFYSDPYNNFGRLTYEMWLSLIHI